MFFLGAAFSLLQAQSLIVRLNDGSETGQLLSTVQKLSFSQDEMLVSFYAGTTDYYAISDIRKLYFDIGASVADNIVSGSGTLSLYPNPAYENITIEGIPEDAENLRIFRSDGQLVSMIKVTNSTMAIDLSGLTPGLYILNTHGSSLRFIKK